MPDVSADADSTTFVIPVSGHALIPPGTRLIVRCDSGGNGWARIVKSGRGLTAS
jgi:hypothetical protein